MKGEGLPKTRWGKLKRWLPEWKDRWEKIEERDSLIYMIVEIATGKVYCGEREQSYSDMWHGHVCTVGRYRRNHNVGTDQMYKRLARRGMQGYVFLPWRKVKYWGERNKKKAGKDDNLSVSSHSECRIPQKPAWSE